MPSEKLLASIETCFFLFFFFTADELRGATLFYFERSSSALQVTDETHFVTLFRCVTIYTHTHTHTVGFWLVVEPTETRLQFYAHGGSDLQTSVLITPLWVAVRQEGTAVLLIHPSAVFRH